MVPTGQHPPDSGVLGRGAAERQQRTQPGPRRHARPLRVPAKRIRVTLNGVECKGGPLPRQREGYQNTSCFLAWAESWLRPR
jgi:hypothetical protein